MPWPRRKDVAHFTSLGRACCVVFVLLSLLIVAEAIPCYPWPQEPIFLYTNKSVMVLNGPQEVGFFPRNPQTGAVDQSVYIVHRNGPFMEVTNYPTPKCADLAPEYLNPSLASKLQVLQKLEWSHFDCQVSTINSSLTDTVNISANVFDMTLLPSAPVSAPDFKVQFNFTLTYGGNHSINFGPGPETDGRELVAQYVEGQVKISFRLDKFPWVGIDNQSYLGFYFQGAVNSLDPYTFYASNTNESEYVAIETRKWKLSQSIDHMFLYEGVPAWKTFDNSYLKEAVWDSVGSNASAYIGGYSSCNGKRGGPMPHWTTIEYDPQFSALFISDSDLADTPAYAQTPAQKKNSNTVKIAIGVVFGVVGLAVIALILAMIFVPSFRNFVRPYAKRSDANAQNPNLVDRSGGFSKSDGGSGQWVHSSTKTP